jgi:hypothetical protein
MKRLRSAISYLKFWGKGTDMPGVADAERKTRALQKQRGRKRDRETLMDLLSEGRLHEADEHQLEQIKLALELSELMGVKQESGPALDEDKLVAAMRAALVEVVANMPKAVGPTGSSVSDPARPKMGHNSMTSISHKDSGLDIEGAENLTQESEGDEDAAEKLRRLKELKGTK